MKLTDEQNGLVRKGMERVRAANASRIQEADQISTDWHSSAPDVGVSKRLKRREFLKNLNDAKKWGADNEPHLDADIARIEEAAEKRLQAKSKLIGQNVQCALEVYRYGLNVHALGEVDNRMEALRRRKPKINKNSAQSIFSLSNRRFFGITGASLTRMTDIQKIAVVFKVKPSGFAKFVTEVHGGYTKCAEAAQAYFAGVDDEETVAGTRVHISKEVRKGIIEMADQHDSLAVRLSLKDDQISLIGVAGDEAIEMLVNNFGANDRFEKSFGSMV